MANLLLSLITLLKHRAPSINSEYLSVLDSSLKHKLSPLHHHISRCTDPARFRNIMRPAPHFSYRISGRKQRTFCCGEKHHSKGFISHPNKTLTELQHLKKVLRKNAVSRAGTDKVDRKKFHSCLKAISELRKVEKRRLLLKTTKKTPRKNVSQKPLGFF